MMRQLKIFKKNFKNLPILFFLAIVAGFFCTEVFCGSILGLPTWINLLVLFIVGILIGFQL